MRSRSNSSSPRRLALLAPCALALVVGLALSTRGPIGYAAAAVPTFNKDVAPIVFQHCTSCHRPGELAPFPLQTYEEVKERARLIAEATAHRLMPPWKPEPGYGAFEGEDERRLSDVQIAIIRGWVEGGMVEGEPKDLPKLPVFTPGWQLGPPDLVVTLPQAFDMPASGPDVFRNFVLPVAIKSRRYVRAIEFRPGPSKAVHHARILIDESRESRWRDARDSAPGFGGMDAPGAHFPDGHFLGWASGKSPTEMSLPWPIDAGTDLVVQTHLKPTGRVERIQPSIGLYFTSKPPAAAPVMLRLGSRTIDIPAGATNYVVSDSYQMPIDAMALRIYPHAHYLAREMTVLATLPGGKTAPLLHIANWDFNWQDDYEYEQPVELPKGSTLQMRYVYDNSPANANNPHTPPQRVRFGPEATDEMGELLVQLVAKKPGEAATLRADITRKTLASDIAGEEKQIAEAPDDVEVRNSLGVHYVQALRLTDAVAQFEAALRLEPDHALAHYNLGLIALNSGRLDAARPHLEHALATRPDFAEAHSNFGVLLVRQGRTREGMEQFERALAIKPDNVPARNNLGRALLAAGRADQAIAHFQRIVELQPDNITAMQLLADAFAATGRYDDAERTGQQALARAAAAKNDAAAREIRQRLIQYEQQAGP